MSAPATIYAVLTALTFIASIFLHGTPRKNPNYDFWEYLPNFLIGTILLMWGGFYS